MNGIGTPQPPRPDAFGLTRRELEIANLFAHGMSVELIARCLWLNPRGIEVRLRNTYRKMVGAPDASSELTPQHQREMHDWLIERGLLLDRSGPEALLTRVISAIGSVPTLPRWVPRREREMLVKRSDDDRAELEEALKVFREVPNY